MDNEEVLQKEVRRLRSEIRNMEQRENATPKVLEDVLKIQRLVNGARKDLDAKNAAAVFHAFNMIMAATERMCKEVTP